MIHYKHIHIISNYHEILVMIPLQSVIIVNNPAINSIPHTYVFMYKGNDVGIRNSFVGSG